MVGLDPIAQLVTHSINHGFYPGAVIRASHQGKIIYHGTFGNRLILPTKAPMQSNTIFDIASLTKVIVTATAILQLIDAKKIQLNAPAATYWPEFAVHGKEKITIRQLLTHTSGLPALLYSPALVNLLQGSDKLADLKPMPHWQGYEQALKQVAEVHPLEPPDQHFLYGDLNFLILGHIVKLQTSMPLNQYAAKYIFAPLAMHDSGYLPKSDLLDQIAPTQLFGEDLRWGRVHDPSTFQMGGVSGIAGVFSTASDLGLFADCILKQGKLSDNKRQLLSSAAVQLMTTPQTPKQVPEKRGLGWDINSPFACGGRNFSSSSFGHTGWTGTSLWIDPPTQTWLIILTSRTHPHPATKSALIQDRKDIADLLMSYTK